MDERGKDVVVVTQEGSIRPFYTIYEIGTTWSPVRVEAAHDRGSDVRRGTSVLWGSEPRRQDESRSGGRDVSSLPATSSQRTAPSLQRQGWRDVSRVDGFDVYCTGMRLHVGDTVK